MLPVYVDTSVTVHATPSCLFVHTRPLQLEDLTKEADPESKGKVQYDEFIKVQMMKEGCLPEPFLACADLDVPLCCR